MGTTSELPLINVGSSNVGNSEGYYLGITNPVSWNSQLVGNFDLNRSELPTFRITNFWNFQQKHRMRTRVCAEVWVKVSVRVWAIVWVRLWVRGNPFSAHCISDQKVRTAVVRSVQKVYF